MMDLVIICELFMCMIEVVELFGWDIEFVKEFCLKFVCLVLYCVGVCGQLQEWCVDYRELELNYWYFLYFYGLYLGNQISFEVMFEFFCVVVCILELCGDEVIGWFMGWKINFWVCMFDGDYVYKIVCNFFMFVGISEMIMSGGGFY